MTELISRTDAYARLFEGRVEVFDPELGAVVLDRSAFYPGGGGQPCDSGYLVVGDRRLRVPKVKTMAGSTWHWIEEGEPIEAGSKVEGHVDWERRYALMRTHTALHILCGVVWRDWGAQVTGGNMEPGMGRMDFEFERLTKDFVAEIEARCNVEVEAAREVRVDVLPRQAAFENPDLIRTRINLLPEGITEVRTIEIVGLDLQADGGTHVANTREVGHIRVKDYKSKGAINKRIYIALD